MKIFEKNITKFLLNLADLIIIQILYINFSLS